MIRRRALRVLEHKVVEVSCGPIVRGRPTLRLFLFTSRRRHARYWRDWSSDVCSSDLSPDLQPLVQTLLDTIPAPEYDAEEPLRAQVTNLDASPFLGRLALLRIHSGEMKRGQQVAWCKTDGTITRTKITELLMTEGLDRTSADSAGPGDLVAIAGIEDIMIGDTLADPNDPRPLPPLTVDEPSRSEEHTSELQSRQYLVCRLLLEKKKKKTKYTYMFLFFSKRI